MEKKEVRSLVDTLLMVTKTLEEVSKCVHCVGCRDMAKVTLEVLASSVTIATDGGRIPEV